MMKSHTVGFVALLEPEEDCELDDTQEIIMEGSNEHLVTWIKWKMVQNITISLLFSGITLLLYLLGFESDEEVPIPY